MVANFRSYEGQIRLLTSVIAAHPELKLNYKGMSASHRSLPFHLATRTARCRPVLLEPHVLACTFLHVATLHLLCVFEIAVRF